MKLSKKFLEDLNKIGQDAFIEKNMWVGKLVPEIIVDNLQKRGISQEDVEGCVVLTVEEAKFLKHRVLKATNFRGSLNLTEEEIDMFDDIEKRIEQAEGRDG